MIKYEDVEEDDSVVVCSPTSWPHVEESIVRQCDFCGADVWFAKTTEAVVPEKHYLMCMDCVTANKIMEKVPMQMPSDEQLRDIAETTGAPFEEVKASITKMIGDQNRSSRYENN